MDVPFYVNVNSSTQVCLNTFLEDFKVAGSNGSSSVILRVKQNGLSRLFKKGMGCSFEKEAGKSRLGKILRISKRAEEILVGCSFPFVIQEKEEQGR